MTQPLPQPHVDDVRSSALKAATALFAEQGVSGTSLQSVADAVGVSKPTLVYHFGGKDGLRRAVLEALLGHWREELPRMMAAATGEGPRLESLLGALYAFFSEDRHRALLLLREALDRPDELRALLQQHLQPWTRLLAEAMRAGQAAGLAHHKAHPEAFVQLMVTAAVGVLAIGDRVNAMQSPAPTVDAQLAELTRVARAALHPNLPPKPDPQEP